MFQNKMVYFWSSLVICQISAVKNIWRSKSSKFVTNRPSNLIRAIKSSTNQSVENTPASLSPTKQKIQKKNLTITPKNIDPMASRSSNTEGKVIGTYSNSFPKLIKYINRCCHFPIQRFVIALTTLVPPAPSLLSSLLSLSTLKHPHNLYKRKNTKGKGSDFFLRILIQLGSACLLYHK